MTKGRDDPVEGNNPIWLPHLTNEVLTGARKTKLCAYTVALEGWRRGLRLKWYTKDSDKFSDLTIFGVNPPGRLFSLSSEKRTHYFFRTRGDIVSNEAVEIGSNKDQTKFWLSKAGVPFPEGKKFGEYETDEEILSYARSVGFPLVLKPTDGSLGRGVVTNIPNEDVLKKALNYVRGELEYTNVLVEQHIPGEEYRIYVVGDQAVGAYNRIPANVTGDGVHTIEELIELKNKERKENPRLYNCLIEIDQEIIELIQSEGYSINSIPKKGKRIFLREKSNVSAGGDPIDVTDELPMEIKMIAVNAVKAVPGLYHGGVDIIVDNSKAEKQAFVIELNPTAQIGGILFPIRGRARDIPAAIIDYYFPETKGISTDRNSIYFDFRGVLEPLQNRSAIEVEVSPAPVGRIYAKRYTVTGNVQHVGYHQRLRKQAFKLNLNGYVKNRNRKAIEVVVAGTNEDAVDRFKDILTEEIGKDEVLEISEEPWKQPVKVGFEIREGSLKNMKEELKRIKKEMKTLEKERKRFERENIKIEHSRSWRYTLPFRKMGGFLKNSLGFHGIKL